MAGKGAGEWAFLISVVIAVLAGLASGVATGYEAGVTALLVILGIIVGLLNITEKETQAFLIASVGLIVASTATFVAIPFVGSVIDAILNYIAVFVAPAAVIVAVKAIASLASSK